MRILLTSDLHGELPDLSSYKFDLALIGGDICPDFMGKYAGRDENPERQAVWMNNKFLPWMPKDCYFTWGNHDFVGQSCHCWLDEQLQKRTVVDAMVEFQGLKIWFSPWVLRLMRWAFVKEDESAIVGVYDKIPEGIDILVSHGPAWGLRDAIRPHITEPLGSTALLKTLHRVKPKVLVCGHIHGGYGYDQLHLEDHVVEIQNVAHMDEGYNPINKPVVIEL